MKKVIVAVFALVLFGAGIPMTVSAADKGLARQDKKFVKEAASAGLMEVQLGQMAQDKGQSQEVKDFGKQMVTDHGMANDELKSILQKKNMPVPEKLESKHKLMVEKVTNKSGVEFDKAYMQMMVKDHTKDVADFKKATQKVKDPEINAWAGKTLPVLEQHLEQAKGIANKLGVK